MFVCGGITTRFFYLPRPRGHARYYTWGTSWSMFQRVSAPPHQMLSIISCTPRLRTRPTTSAIERSVRTLRVPASRPGGRACAAGPYVQTAVRHSAAARPAAVLRVLPRASSENHRRRVAVTDPGVGAARHILRCARRRLQVARGFYSRAVLRQRARIAVGAVPEHELRYCRRADHEQQNHPYFCSSSHRLDKSIK